MECPDFDELLEHADTIVIDPEQDEDPDPPASGEEEDTQRLPSG